MMNPFDNTYKSIDSFPIIDIHMHVIPGVDDGCTCMDESIRMLDLAASQGVRTVIATPHSWGIDHHGILYTRSRYMELQEAIQVRSLPINLDLGCEILVHTDTIADCITKLNKGIYPTMGDSRYVLIEFDPFSFSRKAAVLCASTFISDGYHPIIAHFERYPLSSVDVAKCLYETGAKIQINAYSITNEPNADIRNLACELLSNHLVDFIGSDAHRLTHRPPVISDGIIAMSRLCSPEYMRTVLENNPHELLLHGLSQ